VYCGRAEKESERKDKLKKKYDSIRMERLKNNQLVNLYIKNLDDTIDDDRLRSTFEQYDPDPQTHTLYTFIHCIPL